MDCKTSLAPLALLSAKAAAETSAMLRSLLDDSPDFALSHIGAPNASSFEIVYQGVTFRLAVNAQVDDIIGLKKIFCNIDTTTLRSCVEVHLGDHVAGGERVPAIIQGLLGVARKLGMALGVNAAVWRPADIVSGFEYFSEAVSDYLDGGPFPVMAMVNFNAALGGNIESRGLEFLAGQELHVVCNDMDQSDLMRRVVRIVHDIAINGPIQDSVRLDGIEPGEKIDLRPSSGTAVLNVAISISDA